MNIKYTWTRDDLKRKLYKKRVIPNIIFLVLGIVFYLYFTWYGIIDDNFDIKVIILWFVIYFIVLSAFLFILTKLYVFLNLKRNDRKTLNAYGTYYVKVDKKGICSKINDNTVEYKWEDISKFKETKNNFYIATKYDRLGLRFDRNYIRDEDFERLLNYVKEKLSNF